MPPRDSTAIWRSATLLLPHENNTNRLSLPQLQLKPRQQTRVLELSRALIFLLMLMLVQGTQRKPLNAYPVTSLEPDSGSRSI
jgi:hypothetical protein